ncbi:MAG: hypothetical protein KF726_01730 [Anaerolineae bacterium]|nr:hypothetical protein [Anaerolineae bacterium]
MNEAEAIVRSSNPNRIGNPFSYEGSLYWASPEFTVQLVGTDVVKAIQIKFSDEQSFLLGDAILLWGTPIATKVKLCNSQYPPIMIYFKGDITAYAYFPNDLRVAAPIPIRLIPTIGISTVLFDNPNSFSLRLRQTRQWNGFTWIRLSDDLPGDCG